MKRMDNHAPVAKDIQEALEIVALWDKFTSMAPSHQREYTEWIEAAKKPATRLARIEKMCGMLGGTNNSLT